MLDNLPESTFEIPNSLYQDLLHPALKQLGTAAGTIVGLLNVFTLPFRTMSDVAKIKYEKFLDDFKEKAQQIPQENLVTPEFSIVGPALLDLSFSITEDDVRDMYMNLLLRSIDNRADQTNLRAFVQIIKQLSPFEARLFHFLFENTGSYPAATVHVLCRPAIQTSFTRPRGIKNDTILIDVQFENASEESINLSLQNFLRLGLIEHDPKWSAEPERYKFVETTETYQKMSENLHVKTESGEEFNFIGSTKFFITITSFGEAFLKTCIL